MAAVPKRRSSKGRRNRRRAQDRLSAPSLSVCPKCGKPKRPHFICSYCGYYGGKPKAEPKKTEAKSTKKAVKKVSKK
jgi:large subunit ribosomal protein L32